jgi:LysM repeat protein
LFGGLAQAARQSGTALQSGIGNLLSDPSQTIFGSGSGTLRGLAGSASFSGQNPQQILQRLSEDPAQALKIQSLQSAGVSDVDIIQQITGKPANLANLASGFGSGAGTAPQQVTVQSGDTLSEIAQKAGIPLEDLLAANNIDPASADLIFPGQVLNIPGTGGQQGFLSGLFSGGGRDGVGNMGLLGDLAGGVTDQLGLTNYGLAGGAGGAGGGGGGFNMGALGAAGLAGLLGKLAYEETKGRKGVPLTPSVVMNAAGRFNLENEIARRAGTEAPRPVEFGLLPQGTLPVLSGGRAPTAAQAELEAQKATGMRYGGPVMAFAEGGNVDEQDFQRMNGDINGPGTEVSDDIPAMLSDGEFVMTGRAVRGAGAFDMKNKNGIITLTPTNGESRDRGTKLMYEMMDLFKEFAEAPEAVA